MIFIKIIKKELMKQKILYPITAVIAVTLSSVVWGIADSIIISVVASLVSLLIILIPPFREYKLKAEFYDKLAERKNPAPPYAEEKFILDVMSRYKEEITKAHCETINETMVLSSVIKEFAESGSDISDERLAKKIKLCAVYGEKSTEGYREETIQLRNYANPLMLEYGGKLSRRKVRFSIKKLTGNIIADSDVIDVVLHSVIDNCLELSGKSVLIFARDNGETISIFVQDNGNGIDEALIDNPVSDELPYGTSLYICRKLCENSGLEFTVHSESGNGTAIEIKCRKAL